MLNLLDTASEYLTKKGKVMSVSKIIITTILAFLLVLIIAILFDVRKAKNTGYKKYNLKASLTAYGFMLPALILIVTFVILTIVMSLTYAFTDYYLLEPNNISFIGLDNFKNLFKEIMAKGDFYNALLNTFHFVIFVVPLQIVLALILALLINRVNHKKSTTFFKIAYFAPVVMSLTVVSILWLKMLRPDELGLVNNLLNKFGIENQGFLTDPDQAMNVIVIMSAWQGCGFQMLIFLAALKNVDYSVVESARLDGAKAPTIFWHITLPSIKPTFVFILMTTIASASKLLVQPMVMTGYKDYTLTTSYYIYQEGYYFKMVGFASSAALIMTVVVGLITISQKRLMKED